MAKNTSPQASISLKDAGHPKTLDGRITLLLGVADGSAGV